MASYATSLSWLWNEHPIKTSVGILGGVSIVATLYKAYNALPRPHSSIPNAPHFHPILGHVPFFQNNFDTLHDALYSVIRKHDIVSFVLPGYYSIYLSTPELIEWVYTTQADKFNKKNDAFNDIVCDLFGQYGQAIFVADGKEWRFHRKIGSRMFSVRNLRDYMYKCCTTTTAKTMDILQKLDKSGMEIDICDILNRMTFDCFTSIAFGIEFDSLSSYPEKHPFGVSSDTYGELMMRRFSDPFWKIKRFFNVGYECEMAKHLKIIQDFSNSLINEKRAHSKQNIVDETGKNTFDLFTLYTQYNEHLTNEDLRFIAFNFIIAGRDTTAMLIAWFLYDLSLHSEAKQKVIDEIDGYSEKEGIHFQAISKEFKYLEAALCETLRFHPVAPGSERIAKDDIIIPKHIHSGDENGNNYVIKKGDRVTKHHFTICKLSNFYKDPLKYEPMRFYENGVKTFKQNIYPFFSLLPRMCLGREFALMEAKIFIYHFFKQYNFEVKKNQSIVHNQAIILGMKHGMKINLMKR